MQGIYKIENLINGKCYVGQSVDIKARWAEHRFGANRKNRKTYNYPLYKAIRKYGKKQFKFSVLELVDNKDDLTARELYWYNILKPQYNQIIPESSTTSSFQNKPVYQIDTKNLSIVNEFESIAEAYRKTGVSRGNITMTCKGQRPRANGFYWCYVDEYDTWKPNNSRVKEVPVIKLDKNTGKHLNEYTSISEAAKENDLHISNIWISCNFKTRTTGGYKWAYKT